MKNNFDYSWQINKKILEKNNFLMKFKIFWYIFLWWFFIFSSLVSSDYYFFYQENKKYFSDQKAGFELIWNNLKNNLKSKNFILVEKNFQDLEEKFSKFEKIFLNKINDRKFLIWSKKIFFEWKEIFNDGIFLWRNFLEIEKNFKQILSVRTGLKPVLTDWNPIENILKLNKENLEIFNKIIDPGVGLKNIFINNFLSKKFDFKTTGSIFQELDNNSEFISKILWKNSPQTSVIFFQNSNESRPTGGFAWSFLIFTANNWKILDWKIHDVYEFDGQLKWNFEKIPFEAKTLVWDESWSLRDFNTNPDLSISSKNFNYFFEKSWWKTVDNFFYLDSKILTEILKIIWPIKLKHLWINVDANNWDFVFQYFVESKKNFEKIWVSPKKLMIWEIISSLKNKMQNLVILGLDPGIRESLDNQWKKSVQQTGSPPSREWQIFEKFFDLKNKILEKKYIKYYSNNSEINNLFKKNILNKNFQESNRIQKYFISISWNKSDKFVENKWINWKNNSSKKIISVKRKFFKSKKEKNEFDKFFEFLFKKFWSDIPKNELKRILWFWYNNSILQFYTSKKTWKSLDLLFVKFIWENWVKKNLKFKKWQQWDKNVFEIHLPILKNLEKQEIFFNFKVWK